MGVINQLSGFIDLTEVLKNLFLMVHQELSFETLSGNRIRNILTISIERNASCPKGKKVRRKQ